MPKPFDASLKDLARDYPTDFLSQFDQRPSGPWALLNVDLSTVTTSGDFVVGFGDPLAEIVHIDFQASAKADKHQDLLTYNVLLHRHHSVPVHSMIILLRRQAGHSNLNGSVEYTPRGSRGSMNFVYEVIRLWEIPTENFLQGDLGTVPLATLGQLPTNITAPEAMTAVVQQLVERITTEAPQEQAKKLLTSAFVLSGLRINRELARELFQGAQAMKESDTYMMILDEGKELGRQEGKELGRQEGKELEAKRLLLLFGTERLGSIDKESQGKLEAMSDVAQLEELARRLLKVSSWKELFE